MQMPARQLAVRGAPSASLSAAPSHLAVTLVMVALHAHAPGQRHLPLGSSMQTSMPVLQTRCRVI